MANNLTRYNPFNEVVSLRDAMDRLFEDSFI
jgi:HSP20 family protein